MDDFFLIKQVIGGNRDAFKFLVLRYEKPIFKFLIGFGLSTAAVEEVAQETFLRAFKNLKSYDPKKGASFSTWLFVIAKNLTLNEVSKMGHLKEVYSEKPATLESFPDSSIDPVQGAVLSQNRHSVRNAIQQLPHEFKNAVVLACLQELTLEEIAQIESCSVGTVKSRIFRGKQILQQILLREARVNL